MSADNDELSPAKRTSTLDTLKFRKTLPSGSTSSPLAKEMEPGFSQVKLQSRDATIPPRYLSPSSSISSATTPPASALQSSPLSVSNGQYMPPYGHLPQQSRDATVQSRYFPNSSPISPGTTLVPNSSPDSYRPFSHPAPVSRPTTQSFNPGSMSRGWPGLVANTSDPLAMSTGFRTKDSGHHPRPTHTDAIEPPRKRQHIEHASPESPIGPRPARRRHTVVGSDADSDEDMPEDPIEVNTRSRIARRPVPADSNSFSSSSSSPRPQPSGDQQFLSFKFSYPGVPTERLIAAWLQSGKNRQQADQYMNDPSWIPSPAFASTPIPPKEITGRVAGIDEASKKQRNLDKLRAARSTIYAVNRPQQPRDATVRAIPSTTSSLTSSDLTFSQYSPPVLPKRRITKKLVVDSEEESDAENEAEPESKRQRLNTDASRALEYFNTKGSDALQELTGCTPDQANKIIELRPFEDVEDLNSRLGQGRKKAGPSGISPRMFEDALGIFQGYGTVDSVLEKCEDIGNDLRTAVSSWTSNGKEKETSTPSNETEEGAVSLRSLDGLKTSRPDGYIEAQPSLLSSDVRLKEYQLLGVNWLQLLYRSGFSCILADEMGLGKTIQVISFFALLKEQGNHGPHLIIVPSSTLENWLREFQRFAPSISVRSYYGGKDERILLRQDLVDFQRSKRPDDGWDVLVTTYNLAQGDADRKFFRRIEWNCCVFDEGHVLKNFQSQRYQSLLKVESKWRLLLTGTPLQNNLQELVSLMNFILPEQFGDAIESLRAIFKVKGDSKVSLLAQERVSRAKKMMTPFVLRRRKDQVLDDLPKKTERIEWCEMTNLQNSIYQDAKQRSRRTVLETPDATSPDSTNPPTPAPSNGRNGKQKTKAKPKEKKVYLENSSNVLMDLRKAASHPLLFRTMFTDDILTRMAKQLLKEPDYRKRGAVFELVKEDMTVMTDSELQYFCGTYKCLTKFLQDDKCYLDSGKVQALLKLLDQYRTEGRKILLFSQFTQILDILEVILRQRNTRFLRLTGSTPVDIRQTLVDEFAEDEEIPVFLLSTKAGGMGINLTAASVVIMFDHDFNPHNDRQAQDRAYRIGQKHDVDVIKLVSRGSIEEDMLRLGETKLALDEAVAGEGDDEKGESAPEREMKMSLMKSLRRQFEQEQIGTDSQVTTPG